MSRFFVGQRVRLVRAMDARNYGVTGVITHMGHWIRGDLLPNGYRMGFSFEGYTNCYLRFDWKLADGGLTRPAHTNSLEPILEQHAPCESEFKESLDKLLEGMPA